MSRLILTFPTLFQVLSADKILRPVVSCRPAPTPQGLTSDICGICIEILDLESKDKAIEFLTNQGLPPSGVHEIE